MAGRAGRGKDTAGQGRAEAAEAQDQAGEDIQEALRHEPKVGHVLH